MKNGSGWKQSYEEFVSLFPQRYRPYARRWLIPGLVVVVVLIVVISSTGHSSPTPGKVLYRLSGDGIENSPPFTVPSSPLTADYSYDCSGFGQPGNFIADLFDRGGSNGTGTQDDQPIANLESMGGSGSNTLYPQQVGQQYYIEVNSECSWSVTIKTG